MDGSGETVAADGWLGVGCQREKKLGQYWGLSGLGGLKNERRPKVVNTEWKPGYWGSEERFDFFFSFDEFETLVGYLLKLYVRSADTTHKL